MLVERFFLVFPESLEIRKGEGLEGFKKVQPSAVRFRFSVNGADGEQISTVFMNEGVYSINKGR